MRDCLCRFTRRLASAGTAVLALFAILSGARAQVVFDNFGPGDTYNQQEGWAEKGPASFGAGNFDQGMAFTPSRTGYLSTIEMALFHHRGTNTLDLVLAAEAGGLPGPVIEAYHLDNVLPRRNGTRQPPVVVTSTLHPLLVRGTRYWLVPHARGDAQAAWMWNTIHDRGPISSREKDGPVEVTPDQTRSTFRVTVMPVAVP